MSLNFKTLAEANLLRAETLYHKNITDWSPLEWGGALSGEVGELNNILKKIKKIDSNLGHFNYKPGEQDLEKLRAQAASEIGDVAIYLDLVAQRLQLDLGDCVVTKFNEVSKREGCDIIL